jgi:PadR family transcriptional regulator PadR
MSEMFRKEITQRITKSLLDIQLLRMLQVQSLWGYRIKKKVETDLDIRLRHGALYPTLNLLEKRGFVASERQQQGGRARKVYTITKEGREYLQSYYDIVKDHIRG